MTILLRMSGDVSNQDARHRPIGADAIVSKPNSGVPADCAALAGSHAPQSPPRADTSDEPVPSSVSRQLVFVHASTFRKKRAWGIGFR